MASTKSETVQRTTWAGEGDDASRPDQRAMRPRIAPRPTDEASLPATQSAFYELICIGWLALAATSLWIAILY